MLPELLIIFKRRGRAVFPCLSRRKLALAGGKNSVMVIILGWLQVSKGKIRGKVVNQSQSQWLIDEEKGELRCLRTRQKLEFIREEMSSNVSQKRCNSRTNSDCRMPLGIPSVPALCLSPGYSTFATIFSFPSCYILFYSVLLYQSHSKVLISINCDTLI